MLVKNSTMIVFHYLTNTCESFVSALAGSIAEKRNHVGNSG